jgi:triacylglycerol lipase
VEKSVQFTNTEAAACGLLAMHAMDMYRVNIASLTPAAAPGLTATGWTILGYITGQDAVLRGGPLQLGGRTICYGFLARQASGEMVAVIRGTDGFVEWIEDAEFLPIPYSPQVGLPAGLATMLVEQGFWTLYQSMQLIDPVGAPLGDLAAAITTKAGAAGTMTVIGHSLGSALATYLAIDLARGTLSQRVSACLFASPRAGNQAFVELFDQTLSNYRLFNYILDVVPRVPLGLGYAPLLRRTVIQPTTAEASIRIGIECSHHVICYCAMLDYEGTMQATVPVPAGEEGSAACILAPETGKPSLSKQLVADLGGLIPV